MIPVAQSPTPQSKAFALFIAVLFVVVVNSASQNAVFGRFYLQFLVDFIHSLVDRWVSVLFWGIRYGLNRVYFIAFLQSSALVRHIAPPRILSFTFQLPQLIFNSLILPHRTPNSSNIYIGHFKILLQTIIIFPLQGSNSSLIIFRRFLLIAHFMVAGR